MNKKEFDQIVDFTHFLEKYTQQAMNSNRNKTFSFSEEDKKIWNLYFEMLIKPGILPDGMAFGEPNNDTNVGIGKDGQCYRDEFLQLLMQCYKYLYTALSSGEVFLKYKNWCTSDEKEIV
ncbi:hypothetical protein AAK894_14360 [Lachnospiraceae bacterium 46-61]